MNQILFSLLPSIVLVLLMFAVAYPAIWLNRLKQRRKRSPLTSDLIRSPGESLQTKIIELNDEINLALWGATSIPICLYAVWLTQVHFKMLGNTLSDAALYILIGAGFLVYQAVKLHKIMSRRNDLRLGLDCEQAVGQELNQLMLDGCRVYHDFQADDFNIDHIVIGANGVFAIETKGRAKPDRGRGQEDVRVVYDGQSLQFPTWNEKEPLEQAKRQAEWLTRWLTKAVGEQVTVKPALALPGWYVERKSKDLLIFSGKNPRFIATIRTETPLSPAMVERVSFQIEQQCRDVEPQAYKKG